MFTTLTISLLYIQYLEIIHHLEAHIKIRELLLPFVIVQFYAGEIYNAEHTIS
jgi:hypothetical protein